MFLTSLHHYFFISIFNILLNKEVQKDELEAIKLIENLFPKKITICTSSYRYQYAKSDQNNSHCVSEHPQCLKISSRRRLVTSWSRRRFTFFDPPAPPLFTPSVPPLLSKVLTSGVPPFLTSGKKWSPVLSTFGEIFDHFDSFELYQTSFLDVRRLLCIDRIFPRGSLYVLDVFQIVRKNGLK